MHRLVFAGAARLLGARARPPKEEEESSASRVHARVVFDVGQREGRGTHNDH